MYELHFLLKKEGATPSDYICRVRPAHEWENRSVNAEVYLEPGRYEVLPKITASRDSDKPTMEKLIKQFAERNPQKLRQVGMQYDLAHAKGGIPDEDQKVVERKEKEKRKKKKQTTTTVKMEVEIGVSDSSETVKIEGSSDKKASQEGESERFEDAAENLDSGDAHTANGQRRGDAKTRLEIRPKASPVLPGAEQGDESEVVGGVGQDATRDGRATGDELQAVEKDKKDDEKKEQDDKKDAEKKEKDDKKVDAPDADESSDSDDPGDDSRWNAVCVACLRVYSQDSDLTITLVQPETAGEEEASSSLVQGQEPAGATQ